MHNLNEFFQMITIVKMSVAVLMVILLSVLAEVVSPRFAGVLSGYPLGAAISLFFMGVEIGPSFASESAVYTMLGLVATQTFAYFYYQASSMIGGSGKVWNILLSSLIGILGYFAAASILHFFRPGIIMAMVTPIVSIFLFVALFRTIRNVKIEKRVGLNWRVLLVRSFAAASIILVITSSARLVGPRWAGLFSAFPITMLPFIIIVHSTYSTQHVHAILKNVPRGIGSLIVYCLSVSVFYPAWGAYSGTIISYVLATLYLVLVHIPVRVPAPLRRRIGI